MAKTEAKTRAELEDDMKQAERRLDDLKRELSRRRAAYLADTDQWHDRYVALLREWNKNVAPFNTTVVKLTTSAAPLKASEAQVKTVRQLRRRGVSLPQGV